MSFWLSDGDETQNGVRIEQWQLERVGDLVDCLVNCLMKFEMSFSKAGEALKRRSAGPTSQVKVLLFIVTVVDHLCRGIGSFERSSL